MCFISNPVKLTKYLLAIVYLGVFSGALADSILPVTYYNCQFSNNHLVYVLCAKKVSGGYLYNYASTTAYCGTPVDCTTVFTKYKFPTSWPNPHWSRMNKVSTLTPIEYMKNVCKSWASPYTANFKTCHCPSSGKSNCTDAPSP